MEDAQFLTELYDIVEKNKTEDFDRIIEEKAAYPYLYHLSEIRQNLVDWLPLAGEFRVLERNAECGALTGRLLEKAGEVTCVTEEPAQARIIRARYQEAEGRLTVVTEQEWQSILSKAQRQETDDGKDSDVRKDSDAEQGGAVLADKKYDIILLVGSFFRYQHELAALRGMLNPDGRLVVADANRLGLKYFAGCQEEYQGGYFTGVEGYIRGTETDGRTAAGTEMSAPGMEQEGTGPQQRERCYTRKEYTQLLLDAGFENLEFYYPYPDHKFPSCIYSDGRLPEKGELSDNRRNFDRDRYQFFEERWVYDTLLSEGLFEEFSNSFLIEAGAGGDMELPSAASKKTIYSRFSNERAVQFRIRTDILLTEDGGKAVYKHALKKEGQAHMEHLCHAYRWLSDAYGESNIHICACEMLDRAVRFPYLAGRTLQAEMERAVKRGKMDVVERILREYIRRIRTNGGSKKFEVTPEFTKVFGEQAPKAGLECADASDIDMIFSNILFREGEAWGEHTGWDVIDYEWTFDFPIPKAFILYRAMYFAYYQILNDTIYSLKDLLDLAGITEEQSVVFAGMEEQFQSYLGKGALPVRNMQRRLGTRIRTLEQMEGRAGSSETGMSEILAESAWMKVRKIQYHIDRKECQDGSMICCGWAFAKTWDGRSLPVNIQVTDEAGRQIPAEIHRLGRRDVAEALRIRKVTEPLWGFDCVWLVPPAEGWKIHFSLGNKEQIYVG